jgi:trypsin-like peptidase
LTILKYIYDFEFLLMLRVSVLILLLLLLPSRGSGEFITSAEDLAKQGVNFTWSDLKSKSVKITVEYRVEDGTWRQVNLGSGFLISPDGLFVTAYHVMKFCLEGQKGANGLSVSVDCSAARDGVRYRAINGDREFEIQVVSHLNEADSTRGRESHTPDEIIKQRDFVIAQLKRTDNKPFDYWQLRDFDETAINLGEPQADFQLTPLMPPKRVFIAGFPKNRDIVISEGFLNLTEKHRRGYFAANFELYATSYLQSQGVALNTQWGMGVVNHMSGGPVVDAAGNVIGIVVNGNRNTAGVLSIENVLSTFFSKVGKSNVQPAVILNPTETPLYLRDER